MSCPRRCVMCGIRKCSGTACATASCETVATDHAPFDFRKQKEMGKMISPRFLTASRRSKNA